MIKCQNCERWEDLKVITPFDKKGYWLVCENCKWEKRLTDNQKTRNMFEVSKIYVDCLTHRFTYGNLELEDIKKYVWEKVTMFSKSQEKGR